ncbi:YdcF family protein [Longimicrobium sp.]|uniref:YdcF family protein n=1 Tax=Longimicrobium sp. TaxID=2029185 RepID=UPI002E347C48|nr:YdcF family protein [Longimicrobium sp.]HEX6037630.1 YdcF family protein [Longimicrobium sp.]
MPLDDDDDRTLAGPSAAPPPTPPAPAPDRRRAPLPVRILRGLIKLGLVMLAGWALCLASIHLWGRRNETPKSDAIVVLGAAQYDGRPSPVLKARLDHAIALYKTGVAPVLIMTGGQAPGDTVSEAVVSRRYAIRQGVPASAILTERGGMTTVESMEAVSRLMRSREMKTAVMVSDPFHMLRLKLLARQVGIQGYTSPTRTSPISRNRSEERKHLIRESFSLPFALLQAL